MVTRVRDCTGIIEVELEAEQLDVGSVRDYHELAALKSFLDETVDHKHLNDVLGHDRTAPEAIAKWLFDWCRSL